jgi:hypothetical protein
MAYDLSHYAPEKVIRETLEKTIEEALNISSQ